MEDGEAEGGCIGVICMIIIIVVVMWFISSLPEQSVCDMSHPTTRQMIQCEATLTVEAHNR